VWAPLFLPPWPKVRSLGSAQLYRFQPVRLFSIGVAVSLAGVGVGAGDGVMVDVGNEMLGSVC
jgi:F0F1-type ATP synthase membrane subunit c/vacuolar-type H+-ATPase subunit K